MKGQSPDPKSGEQVLLVAEIIRDREFGAVPGDYRRLLERAVAEPGTYAASTIRRLVATAQHVLAALRDATAP